MISCLFVASEAELPCLSAAAAGTWESECSNRPVRGGSLPLPYFAEANRCCPRRQGLWTKKTLFEVGTRVPLIIAAPHLPASHGQTTLHIAELVDVCESSYMYLCHPLVARTQASN